MAHRQAAPDRRRGRRRVRRGAQGVRPQQDPARPEPRHPRGQDLDDPRPVRHRQVGLHQAHGRAALPRRRRRPRARRVGAEHARRRAVRDAQEVRRPVPGRRAVRLDEPVRQRRVPAAPAHRQGRGRDRGDRHAPAARGRPRGLARQGAQRALGRHAQARRLRPRAGARPRHRALRRARLGPRPGPHGAAVRADPGGPRGERRRLRGDHARHHVGQARRRVHRGAVEGPDRRVRARPTSSSTPTTSSCASSSPAHRRDPWGWSDPGPAADSCL